MNLITGAPTLHRSLVAHNGQMIVKDTTTHQMRRISRDEATVEILGAHQKRRTDRCTGIVPYYGM